jgi:hypothetical protein
MICGTNTSTAPMPPMTASPSSPASHGLPTWVATSPDSHPKNVST